MVEPWYSKGLRFKCTGCGGCCTGAPGLVFVSDEEIESIASHLNMPLERFVQRYIREVGGRLCLKERYNFDCVFLEGKECKIYEQRPTQCRTFPFWPHNLKSKEAWEQTAHECEGISDAAPLVELEKIEAALAEQERANPDV